MLSVSARPFFWLRSWKLLLRVWRSIWTCNAVFRSTCKVSRRGKIVRESKLLCLRIATRKNGRAEQHTVVLPGSTPNLPTKIMPTKIAWLKLSGKFSMGLGIPPLKIKILLGSNPPKSRILAWRSAVSTGGSSPDLEPQTSVRERGSAPRRGRHSTIFVSTKCICAVAAWRFDNPHQKVVPRSRIPRSTSHLSYWRAKLAGSVSAAWQRAPSDLLPSHRVVLVFERGSPEGVSRGVRQGRATPWVSNCKQYSGGITCLTLLTTRLTLVFFKHGKHVCRLWCSLTRRKAHKTNDAVLDK